MYLARHYTVKLSTELPGEMFQIRSMAETSEPFTHLHLHCYHQENP
jgi:hypothetical protein